MKKGFTMIELIFVIVILGILASVAIPRLAATREDAEISAAVANLRTLVSDATAYYTAKGFATNGTTISTKWKDLTNVPVSNSENAIGSNTSLKVGGKDCIDFLVKNKNGTTPAYILIAKKTNGVDALCQQVQNSEPLKPYFTPTVTGATDATAQNGKGSIAISSSTSIY
ncbi:MAG: type II secretion system GspH family protein [Campylobacter sp.]|nr:type II secretion system GspH family protein [Campylobacter sp.]